MTPPGGRDALAVEAEAWEEMEVMLGWWDDDDGTWRICPHCGTRDRFMFLTPRPGPWRLTRMGRPTARRIWKCGACRRQFTAITGTGLAGTKLPIDVWLSILNFWIDMREHGEQPQPQDLKKVHSSLRGNEAFRAWYRVAHCSDDDPLLTTYRDWR